VPVTAQPNVMLSTKMLENINPDYFKIFDRTFTGMRFSVKKKMICGNISIWAKIKWERREAERETGKDYTCLYISLTQNKDDLIYSKSQVNDLKTK